MVDNIPVMGGIVLKPVAVLLVLYFSNKFNEHLFSEDNSKNNDPGGTKGNIRPTSHEKSFNQTN
ncbi:hypothetical protein KIH87_14090 [Paraneptunicella aestuarii]|uniref:hypothetical protein n=1 Tax=Paraneptunicella aestuarii TaxID=2831148 RepID=UPI001E602408|nr:hypothetical protein [Paraneptunicella aestuarii]UAA37823.1 hypothetical protein KIH87_14090 [Paraneptunicella aestuarii]